MEASAVAVPFGIAVALPGMGGKPHAPLAGVIGPGRAIIAFAVPVIVARLWIDIRILSIFPAELPERRIVLRVILRGRKDIIAEYILFTNGGAAAVGKDRRIGFAVAVV